MLGVILLFISTLAVTVLGDCPDPPQPTHSCVSAGGYCINNRRRCPGGVFDPRGCIGRGCGCCIPGPGAEDVNTQNDTNDCPAVRRVSFAYSGGTPFATNSFSHNFSPMNAFLSGGGYQGYWTTTGGPPVNLWFEFPNPIRVVEYSFASRTDAPYTVTDGPSQYIFWASNAVGNCANGPRKKTLVSDMSGMPFTENNEPKKRYFTNSNKYYCYGFYVIDVPGRDDGSKFVGISNVQYYEIP